MLRVESYMVIPKLLRLGTRYKNSFYGSRYWKSGERETKNKRINRREEKWHLEQSEKWETRF